MLRLAPTLFVFSLVFWSWQAHARVLPVPFLSQGSGNNNCGPVSLAMAACYNTNQVPTQDMVQQINSSLGLTDQATKGYRDLVTAGSAVYKLDLQWGKEWDLDRIAQQLAKGGPVIAGVNAGILKPWHPEYGYSGSHWLVVTGLDADHVVCNDPGTRKGEQRRYPRLEFSRSLSDDGGMVVYGFAKDAPTASPGKAVDEAKKKVEKTIEQKKKEYEKRLAAKMQEAIEHAWQAFVRALAKFFSSLLRELERQLS